METNNKHFQATEERLSYIEKKIDRIIMYLFGDDENTQHMGALTKIKELEDRIATLERMKIKLYGVIIGISTVAGWGLSDIVKSFFK
jgi:hypothetical protein